MAVVHSDLLNGELSAPFVVGYGYDPVSVNLTFGEVLLEGANNCLEQSVAIGVLDFELGVRVG